MRHTRTSAGSRCLWLHGVSRPESTDLHKGCKREDGAMPCNSRKALLWNQELHDGPYVMTHIEIYIQARVPQWG